MRTAIIVNPAAGRNRSAKLWPDLAKILQNRAYSFESYFTAGQGDATRLAEDLSGRVERIVVVGGDGTVHEVVQGIVERKVELAVIPTGTGNDFVRSLGIAKDPVKALDLLFQGRAKKIDVGRVNNRYFVNVAGLGFDAAVVHAVNTSYKYISGTATYLLALLKTLITYQNANLKVRVGDKTLNSSSLLVAVGNGSWYGGGMKIVPDAILDDGQLDICIVGNITKPEILWSLPKIFNGSHVTHPKVTMLKGQEINIEAETPMVIQADGEIIGHAPAGIRVLPQALTVLVPN